MFTLKTRRQFLSLTNWPDDVSAVDLLLAYVDLFYCIVHPFRLYTFKYLVSQ